MKNALLRCDPRIWLKTIFILAGLASLLSACRLNLEPKSEINSFNSTIETGESAVYKITVKYPDLDDDHRQRVDSNGQPKFVTGGCSMTAYAPRFGITAAHCVVDDTTGKVAGPKDVKVYFRNNTYSYAKRVVANPGYILGYDQYNEPSRFDYGKDLALIEFDVNFPKFKKMAKIIPSPNLTEVKIVGFGLRGHFNPGYISYLYKRVHERKERKLAARLRAQDPSQLIYLDSLRGSVQKLLSGQSPSTSSADRKAVRLMKLVKKIEGTLRDDQGRYVKRSGKTKLATIVNSIDDFYNNVPTNPTSSLLIYNGKFFSNVLNDDLDKELFYKLAVYAPDENSDPSSSISGFSSSFGDSGGPMFVGGNLVGVSSHGYAEPVSYVKTSAYVNLSSKKSLEFLAAQKANGWEIPQVASTNDPETVADDSSVSQPEEGQSTPNAEPAVTQESLPVNNDLAAALASRPNEKGLYYLLISSGVTAEQVWVCEKVTTIDDCATIDNADQSARSVTIGPIARSNWQVRGPINILNSFAIMTKTPAGLFSGVLVKGIKK